MTTTQSGIRTRPASFASATKVRGALAGRVLSLRLLYAAALTSSSSYLRLIGALRRIVLARLPASAAPTLLAS
eukprot:6333548-Prymnesium_polylepis.1